MSMGANVGHTHMKLLLHRHHRYGCTHPIDPNSSNRSFNFSKSKSNLVTRELLGFLQPNFSVAKRNIYSQVVYANTLPNDPMPSAPPPGSGGGSSVKSWFLGILLSVILPFFTNKWGPLWVLKNKIENAVQTVEHITEAVEKVAAGVDKIAEDMGDDLPEGDFKKLVSLVEDVAEKTAKSADSLDNLIDKVQEAHENIETMVDSIHKEAKMPTPSSTTESPDKEIVSASK